MNGHNHSHSHSHAGGGGAGGGGSHSHSHSQSHGHPEYNLDEPSSFNLAGTTSASSSHIHTPSHSHNHTPSHSHNHTPSHSHTHTPSSHAHSHSTATSTPQVYDLSHRPAPLKSESLYSSFKHNPFNINSPSIVQQINGPGFGGSGGGGGGVNMKKKVVQESPHVFELLPRIVLACLSVLILQHAKLQYISSVLFVSAGSWILAGIGRLVLGGGGGLRITFKDVPLFKAFLLSLIMLLQSTVLVYTLTDKSAIRCLVVAVTMITGLDAVKQRDIKWFYLLPAITVTAYTIFIEDLFFTSTIPITSTSFTLYIISIPWIHSLTSSISHSRTQVERLWGVVLPLTGFLALLLGFLGTWIGSQMFIPDPLVATQGRADSISTILLAILLLGSTILFTYPSSTIYFTFSPLVPFFASSGMMLRRPDSLMIVLKDGRKWALCLSGGLLGLSLMLWGEGVGWGDLLVVGGCLSTLHILNTSLPIPIPEPETPIPAYSTAYAPHASSLNPPQQPLPKFVPPVIRAVLKHVLRSPESSKIFYFLLLNLVYLFVQLFYGVWTNSLGLISDAIHMAFDCAALAVGLFASVMATWKPDITHTYGYGRVETLSGFANGVFLILISVFIIFEAIQRVMDPPDMSNMRQLLIVSTGGLLINLWGMYATGHHHHGHSHGSHEPDAKPHSHGDSDDEGDCDHPEHSHDHKDHNHSHGHEGHDHSHDHKDHDHKGHSHDDHDHHDHDHGHSHGGHDHHGHSHNMRGVFLHVMADTLGSVGVIVSTLLIEWTGWTVFDPIASLFIAGLIIASVVPLVVDSGKVLALQLDDYREKEIRKALTELSSVPGLESYGAPRFWPKDESTLIGSIHIHIAQSRSYYDPSRPASERSSFMRGMQPVYVNPDKVVRKVEKILLGKIRGLKELSIQVEGCEAAYCSCTTAGRR